jgi:hypothetical protein
MPGGRPGTVTLRTRGAGSIGPGSRSHEEALERSSVSRPGSARPRCAVNGDPANRVMTIVCQITDREPVAWAKREPRRRSIRSAGLSRWYFDLAIDWRW